MKITARWLTSRKNSDGSRRFYFQPRSADTAKGWPATVALLDEARQPLRDPAMAARACEPLAQLYDNWLAGLPGHGPERIDRTRGRVLDPAQRPLEGRQRASDKRWLPGTVGAIVADYEAEDGPLSKLAASTQADYRYTNSLLVAAFGEYQWRSLSPSDTGTWVEAIMSERGEHLGHQVYRQSRAVFGKTRRLYPRTHPGHIPKAENPFAALDIETPGSQLIVWTADIVAKFVAHCDAQGQPSMGTAALFMSWIGTRRNDWSKWPLDFFDRDVVGFRPRKTRRSSNKAVVIPWTLVPELRQRIEAEKKRVAKLAVTPTTFFFNDANSRPWTEKSFGIAFRALRDSFAELHPAFHVHYLVELIDTDPFLLPTRKLTARSWRHTCITLLLDKGAKPEEIVPITGHTLDGVKTIEKNYRALTAEQAARGLAHRTGPQAAPVTDIKEAKG